MFQVCSLDILEFKSMAATAPLLQPHYSINASFSMKIHLQYMVQHEGFFPFFLLFSFAFASWLP